MNSANTTGSGAKHEGASRMLASIRDFRHESDGRAQLPNRRSVLRALLVGVVLIFGGEALCVFGPHTRIVHVGCHAVLYAGIFLGRV
jgi:hypothetical protein